MALDTVADSKMDIKKIVKDSIQEYLAPLVEEVESLSKSVNRSIDSNHLATISRVLEREAFELTNSFTCSYDIGTGIACKTNLRELISNYTQALALGDLSNALTEITHLEQQSKTNVHDPDRQMGCTEDWKEITRVITRHKDIIKELRTTYSRTVPTDIGELDFDPDELHDDVIFPFSHPIRIKILHSLKNGGKRFTALKNELDVKNTGLLVHHLKPLTEKGFVIQDHRKQYSLSEKGYTIARYFSQIMGALSPKEFSFTMQPLVVLQD